MTKADLTRLALELPIDEQLDLAQALWEQASPPADFCLTPELADLLEARLQEAIEHSEAAVPWEDTKAHLLNRT